MMAKWKNQELIIAYANLHNAILMGFDPDFTHLDDNTIKYTINCKDGRLSLEVIVKEVKD